MLRRAAVAAVAVLGLLRAPARAEGERPPLGRLEQESVDDAVARLGLTIDPAPQGKTIGQIHVVNQEVFSKRDWWFQWFNHFHRTTRNDVMARELLVGPGQPYDAALVEESMRNLQSPSSLAIAGRTLYQPELSSVVVILPVRAPQPGVVDLLVVTRDLWSLRFNTDFEFQGNALVFLATSLSENNFLGWRKYVSFGFTLDQGTYYFGPTYFDPNIHGSRLVLYASAFLYTSRETGDTDGNRETFSLRYPLFALASRWGAGIDVIHQSVVFRSFRGNNVRRVQVPGTNLIETAAHPNQALRDLQGAGFADLGDPFRLLTVPYIYRQHNVTVDGSAVRSFRSPAGAVIQRLTLGYFFDVRSSEVPPEALALYPDPLLAPAFLNAYAPVPEQRSEPYLRYQVFTPRYTTFRDLDTFDLRENRLLGPQLRLRIPYGLPALGADFRALGMSAAASWVVAPRGAYGFLSGSVSTRLRAGGFIDKAVSAEAYAASPILARFARVLVMGKLDATADDTQRTRFALGGRSGLRGYAIGDFLGTTAVVGHVEARTVPLAIYSQRFGGLLFYDVGNAADSFAQLVAYHDFGMGLRWLIPQLNSSVVRIDWAIATQNTAFTRAGLPGRVTAGFQQVF